MNMFKHNAAVWLLMVVALAVTGCKTPPVAPSVATQVAVDEGVVRFAATGCGPYKETEFDELARYIARENARGNAEFLVHLGDTLPGGVTIDRAYSKRVAALLRRSLEPVFVVLGDNEWNDQKDPSSALTYWREDFQDFHERWSGRPGWTMNSSSPAPEATSVTTQAEQPGNFAFLRRGVLFVGVTLPGGTVHDQAEWDARLPRNAAWVAQQMEAYGDEARAVVVFGQALLGANHDKFTVPFRAAAKAYGKPVLYLHADGHRWQESRPFEEAPNLLVVQTDQVGISPPALVTVKASGPDIFAFDRQYQRGPYLAMGTPTSTTVVWRSSKMTAPTVRYGTKPGLLDQRVNSQDIVVKSFNATTGEGELHSARAGSAQYEATITGLNPATKYYYAVHDGTKRLAGGSDYYFRTNPVPGSRTPFRFWVVGDSGTGGQDQANVHTAMRRYIGRSDKALDLYVHVGDMAYGSGTDDEFQWHYFQPYDLTLRNVVAWPAMGNHEGQTSSGATGVGPYYDAYVLPTRGEAGGVASGTEAYYAFDYGNVHFIALNSHDLDRQPNGAMAQWLKADLEQTKADWLIAFWHHPPYTKGSHDSDTESQLIEMRQHIMPILEAGGVDVVFTGHSHIYERSMLMDGAYETPTFAQGKIFDDGDGDPSGDGAYRKSAGLEPHNGTVQVVAGHGGTGLSRVGTMPVMKRVILDHGSVITEVNGDTLRAIMLDDEGKTRDVFEIVKRETVVQTRIENPKLLPAYVNYARLGAAVSLDKVVDAGQPTTATLSIPMLPANLSASVELNTANTSWTITPSSTNVAIEASKPTTRKFDITYAKHLYPLPTGSITYTTPEGPVKSALSMNVPAYKVTTIKPMAAAPTIDGHITDAEVAGLTTTSDMIAYAGTGAADFQSTFSMGIHGDQLYIAVTAMEPSMSNIKARTLDRDGPIWEDDCVEVFIQREGAKDYFQMNVNPAGSIYDAKNGWNPDDVAWNGNWNSAAAKSKDRWTVEFLVPLSMFDQPIKAGDVLRFNLCRNNVAQGEYSQWSHTNKKSSHAPQFFGRAVVE